MKLSLWMGPHSSAAPEPRTTVQAMALAQQANPDQNIEIFDLPQGALGITHSADRHSHVSLTLRGKNGSILACGGTPIAVTAGGLRASLQQAVSGTLDEALTLLAGLDGGFSAVLWHAPSQQLAVVSDFFGCNPLYLNEDRGLLLASELRGMNAARAAPATVNPVGWGAFVSFGFSIGDRSMLAGARKFPAATWMVFDRAGKRVRDKIYWTWPADKPVTSLAEVDTGAIVDALKRSMLAYLEHSPDARLLLSGGLDSRLILSLLCELGIPVDALAVDHPDETSNADGILAVKVAKLFGIKYRLCKPRRDYYSTAPYLDYLIRGEVASPSLYLFIATLEEFLQPEHRAIWEGLVPPATLGNYRSARSGMQGYLDYACKKPDSPHWQAVAQVFTPALAKRIADEFREHLNAETSRYAQDVAGANLFAISNRTANRFAPNPFKVFSNDVLPFTVGLTKSFWEACAVPSKLKSMEALYLEVYRRHFPRAFSLPFCSSGQMVNVHGRFNRYRWWHEKLKWENQPIAGRIIGRLRGPYWQHSRLLEDVLSGVDPDHPDLNGASVRELIRQQGRPSLARNLLFYWAMWRKVMQGTATPELAALRSACTVRG